MRGTGLLDEDKEGPVSLAMTPGVSDFDFSINHGWCLRCIAHEGLVVA